jgi:hypothetical protein
MKNRVMFYLFIVALIVLDSVLIRSPNLLGKIGLIIYKYSYLRTFPRTLMTVSSVVGIAVMMTEIIRWMTKREVLKRTVSLSILSVFALISIALLVKTGIDFTAWSYSHTGLRFRIGAYLLPVILVLVFGYSMFTLPKSVDKPWPTSPVMEEKNKE